MPETEVIESDQLERLRLYGEAELSRQFAAAAPRLKRMISLRTNPRLRQRVDDSDVLQEAYIEAVRRLDDYVAKPTIPLHTWMRKITQQVLARQHRHHFGAGKRTLDKEQSFRPVPILDTDSLSMGFAASITSPGSHAARNELCQQVRQLLLKMSPLEREVLCLKKLEGLTYEEIASELEISLSTAKRRMVRAMDHFRKLSRFLEE